MDIKTLLTGKLFGIPNWLLILGGGIGLAFIVPRFLGKSGANKDNAGLGNSPGTGGSATTDPNLDPLTGVPWSVENAIDPETGLPYYATLFGPKANAGNAGVGGPPPPPPPPGSGPTGEGGSGGVPANPPKPGGGTGVPPKPVSKPLGIVGRTPVGGTGATGATGTKPATQPLGIVGRTPVPPERVVSPTAWPSQTSTLAGIAQRYGVTTQRLQQLNPWIYQQRGTWNTIYMSDKIRIA